MPWKQGEAKQETPDEKKEKKETEKKLNALAPKWQLGNGTADNPKPFVHPCQLLRHRQKLGIKQRNEVWPRDKFQNPGFHLEKEFRAIMENQAGRFKQLAGNTDWILYGDTGIVKKKSEERRVYFKTTKCENPGVLGLRWPRFDNRNPGLDLLKPIDEMDRPLHVVRRNKPVFRETQFEQALFNFCVIDKPPAGKFCRTWRA